MQDASPDGVTDVDMAQLADSDLQGLGLPGSSQQQHQQESMDSETVIHVTSSSGPATTSTKPPLASKPNPHLHTPGPSRIPQPPQEPLESKKRYMIDEDDDLDLVEAGAGNRHIVTAVSDPQSSSPPVGEAENDDEDEEEGSQEKVDLDVQTRFLSVTRHPTGECLQGGQVDVIIILSADPGGSAARGHKCMCSFK